MVVPKVTDEAAGSCAGTAEQQSTGQAEAAEDMPDQAVGQEAVQPLEDGYVVVGRGSEEGAQLANGLPCARPASTEETPPQRRGAARRGGLCEAGKPAAVLPALDWTAVAIPPSSHAAQPTPAHHCTWLSRDTLSAMPVRCQSGGQHRRRGAEAGADGTVARLRQRAAGKLNSGACSRVWRRRPRGRSRRSRGAAALPAGVKRSVAGDGRRMVAPWVGAGGGREGTARGGRAGDPRLAGRHVQPADRARPGLPAPGGVLRPGFPSHPNPVRLVCFTRVAVVTKCSQGQG